MHYSSSKFWEIDISIGFEWTSVIGFRWSGQKPTNQIDWEPAKPYNTGPFKAYKNISISQNLLQSATATTWNSPQLHSTAHFNRYTACNSTQLHSNPNTWWGLQTRNSSTTNCTTPNGCGKLCHATLKPAAGPLPPPAAGPLPPPAAGPLPPSPEPNNLKPPPTPLQSKRAACMPWMLGLQVNNSPMEVARHLGAPPNKSPSKRIQRRTISDNKLTKLALYSYYWLYSLFYI